MFEWQQERGVTFDKFFCSLQSKMNDYFYEYEQQICNLKFEKKQVLEVNLILIYYSNYLLIN